jgi:hypothetical protein
MKQHPLAFKKSQRKKLLFLLVNLFKLDRRRRRGRGTPDDLLFCRIVEEDSINVRCFGKVRNLKTIWDQHVIKLKTPLTLSFIRINIKKYPIAISLFLIA